MPVMTASPFMYLHGEPPGINWIGPVTEFMAFQRAIIMEDTVRWAEASLAAGSCPLLSPRTDAAAPITEVNPAHFTGEAGLRDNAFPEAQVAVVAMG